MGPPSYLAALLRDNLLINWVLLMKTCKKCQGSFPHSATIDGKKRKFTNREHCFVCVPFGSGYAPNKEKPVYRVKNNAAVTSYRQKMKERAVEYKGGCCQNPECKYFRCIAALTFHHIDPRTKAFAINDGRTRNWEKLKEELDKCILLCHNCHTEVHAGVLELRPLDSNQDISL